MKVIVTGAKGFVGRYLAVELADHGFEVIATDLSAIDDIDGEAFPEGTGYIACDLLDAGAVADMIGRSRPEGIFHLAAQSSAARSFEDPRSTFEVNLIGTVNLLEAERKAGTEARILLTGSCEEYGRRPEGEMPLSEESPVEPTSPYAASKAAQNLLGSQYFRSFGSRIISTRSFSHTGPGQSEKFVLPSFAKQCAAIAAELCEPVIMTGNISVTRDFLDVRDVVRAYRMLMERGRAGETYNVASGRGIVLGDALERLIALSGRKVAVEEDPSLLRPVDVPVLVGDNSKLKRDTGWEIKIDTYSMLAELFRWWAGRVREE